MGAQENNRGEDVCVCDSAAACCVSVCPEFPGKGGSHQRGGQEAQTGLTSFSSPDGRPDSDCVCVCLCQSHIFAYFDPAGRSL